MAESLSWDIFAVDKASEVFKKVGENGEDMGEKFGKLGKVVAAGIAGGLTALVGGIGAITKIGIDEFKENQVAVAQLNTVLQSTGGVSGTTSKQMQELADSIQNYSGQTHESIEASETQLLAFTNIHDAAGKNNDILTQATGITADLAARMGGDASTYAIKLGKALNDPTQGLAGLTKMGVQFTAAQKDQINAMVKSGDTLGAQKLILSDLTLRYGGAAKAAGETLPGMLNRAKLAFEDVAASLVQKLIPVITTVVGWITDKLIPLMGQIYDTEGPKVSAAFADLGNIISTDVEPVLEKLGGFVTGTIIPAFESLGNFVSQHKTLFEALAVAVGAMILVWETYQITMGVVKAVSEAFAAVQAAVNAVLDANPIGIVVLALAGLAAGFVYAYQHSQTFRDIVQGVFKDVSGAFDSFKQIVSDVFGFIQDHWQIILIAVFGPFGLAIDGLVTHWGTFKQVVTDVWDVVKGAIQDAWKLIKPILDQMSSDIGDVVGAASKITGVVGSITSHLPHFAGGTSAAPGGLALVGEHGPELVKFRGGESVSPAASTANALATGGGMVRLHPDDMADLVAAYRDTLKTILAGGGSKASK